MIEFLSGSAYFGALLCIVSLFLGRALARRFPHPLMNVQLLAIALCSVFLLLLRIDYADFMVSAEKLTWLLTPATAALAIPLYEQIDQLRRHKDVVLLAVLAGTLTSLLTILGIRALCGLTPAEYVTLLPKSVTTAIGMPLAERLGGVGAITAVTIALTGVSGHVMAPILFRLAKIEEPVAVGLALGTSCHAIGTTQALERGPVQGAMSGLAIAVAGLMTAVLAPIFALL